MPYMLKSYHSIVVPSMVARSTFVFDEETGSASIDGDSPAIGSSLLFSRLAGFERKANNAEASPQGGLLVRVAGYDPTKRALMTTSPPIVYFLNGPNANLY